MRKLLGLVCVWLGLFMVLGTAGGNDGQLEEAATSSFHVPISAITPFLSSYAAYLAAGFLLLCVGVYLMLQRELRSYRRVL